MFRCIPTQILCPDPFCNCNILCVYSLVLGHPRVRAFVSHCGANSVHEAIFHGVPVVAVPFFDDQRYNGPRLVQLGLAAASLSKEHMTEAQAVAAVSEALCSVRLREKMRAASEEARGADGLGALTAEAEKLIRYSVSHPHVHINSNANASVSVAI